MDNPSMTLDHAGVEQRVTALAQRQASTMVHARQVGVVAIALLAIAVLAQYDITAPIPVVTDLTVPSGVADALRYAYAPRGSFAASNEALDELLVNLSKLVSLVVLALGTPFAILHWSIRGLLLTFTMFFATSYALPTYVQNTQDSPRITLSCMEDKTCEADYRSAVAVGSTHDHFLRAQVAAASGKRAEVETHLRALREAGALPDLRSFYAPAVAAIVVAAGEQPGPEDALAVADAKKRYLRRVIARNVGGALGSIATLLAGALGSLALGMGLHLRQARALIGPAAAGESLESEPMEMDLELEDEHDDGFEFDHHKQARQAAIANPFRRTGFE